MREEKLAGRGGGGKVSGLPRRWSLEFIDIIITRSQYEHEYVQ